MRDSAMGVEHSGTRTLLFRGARDLSAAKGARRSRAPCDEHLPPLPGPGSLSQKRRKTEVGTNWQCLGDDKAGCMPRHSCLIPVTLTLSVQTGSSPLHSMTGTDSRVPSLLLQDCCN